MLKYGVLCEGRSIGLVLGRLGKYVGNICEHSIGDIEKNPYPSRNGFPVTQQVCKKKKRQGLNRLMKTIDSLLFRVFIWLLYLLAIAAVSFPFIALIIDQGAPWRKDLLRFSILFPLALLCWTSAKGLSALFKAAKKKNSSDQLTRDASMKKNSQSLLLRVLMWPFYLLAIAAASFPFVALIIDPGDPWRKDLLRFYTLIPLALLSLAVARGLPALLEMRKKQTGAQRNRSLIAVFVGISIGMFNGLVYPSVKEAIRPHGNAIIRSTHDVMLYYKGKELVRTNKWFYREALSEGRGKLTVYGNDRTIVFSSDCANAIQYRSEDRTFRNATCISSKGNGKNSEWEIFMNDAL